jgi:hypothetical protein
MTLGDVRTRTARALLALGLGAVLTVAGPVAAAAAQTGCDEPAEAGIATDCVTTTTRNLPAPAPEQASTPTVQNQGLAFTGGDLAGLAAIGAAAAGAGLTLTVVGRRRRANSPDVP